MFFKTGILKNFAIFAGKHLYWGLVLTKFITTFLKKRLQHKCFTVNLHKFFRTAFFIEQLRVRGRGCSDHFVIRHYCANFEHIRVNIDDLVLLLITLKDICVFGNS